MNMNPLPLNMQSTSTFPHFRFPPQTAFLNQGSDRGSDCPPSFHASVCLSSLGDQSASHGKAPCRPASRTSLRSLNGSLCVPSWFWVMALTCLSFFKPFIFEVELFFCNLLAFPVSSFGSFLSVCVRLRGFLQIMMVWTVQCSWKEALTKKQVFVSCEEKQRGLPAGGADRGLFR